MKRTSWGKCGKHVRCLTVFFLCVAAVLLFCGYTWKRVLSVPYISQEGSYCTGCELVSTTMVLNYYGYGVTAADVVSRTPHADLRQTQGGLVGEDPAHFFIGDPTSPDGFGCYAPVVASVMNSFFCEDGRKKAEDITGEEFARLVPYIDRGDPVLVWATMNMQPPYEGRSWKLTGTGETFRWPAREHCLVLVGYDRSRYYFNDPYCSNGLTAYDKSLVEERYRQLGKQAVVAVDS